MTEREFLQKLRRGLGGAILELKANPDRHKYREFVLRSCLRDCPDNPIVDGCKGHYLYRAVCILDGKDFFEKILTARFLSRCPDPLFSQLANILYRYALDGSESAKKTLRSRYNCFAAKRRNLIRTIPVDEGWQWEEVAEYLFEFDGFAAFKRTVLDVGERLRRRPGKSSVYYYARFIRAAAARFGWKRTHRFLDSMYEKSAALKALTDTLEREKLSDRQDGENRKNRLCEKITVGALLNAAREIVSGKTDFYDPARSDDELYDRLDRDSELHGRFNENASDGERMELAQAIVREESDAVKAWLLGVFSFKPFPLGIAPLLEFVRSPNKKLSERAIHFLTSLKDGENRKDEAIHGTAIQLLEEKGLNSLALSLLAGNYRKTDDSLILKLVKKAFSIPAHAQGSINDIYGRHRSANAFLILMNAYQKGESPFVRYDTVRTMRCLGVLPDSILEECLHDSYYDTRKWAERMKRKVG